MSELIIKQSRFYKNEPFKSIYDDIEGRYHYVDETNYFGNLVNFSTAKNEPYQRWVRYREGYSTILVNELLHRARVDKQNHFIADPMVGSGSTIISATKNGYDSLGIDVNPYCQLIVATKLLSPTENDLQDIESFICSLPDAFSDTNYDRPPFSEFFPENNLINILGLRKSIEEVSNPISKQILTACWFFILENCSNRKKDGNGLATRPAPMKDVVAYFKVMMAEILTDYRTDPLNTNTKSKVITGSAKDFSTYSSFFEEETGKKLGAIIFSPPYANAFDYFESYKMELLFGQLYSPDDYQFHKKEQIRNYRISYGKELHCDCQAVELLCDAINEAIPYKEALTGKRDSRTRLMPNMLKGYFTDMECVLKELYKALEPQGHCYIVVDQSAYVGVIVPTDVLLANIAEVIGFSVDDIIICRNAATSVQQRKSYPYLGSTLRESIVCLQKTDNR